MQFGESANGSDVEIKVGEEFELSLPETRDCRLPVDTDRQRRSRMRAG